MPDYDAEQVQRAAEAVQRASANDPEPPVLPTIPAPRTKGKRTLVCPEKRCGYEFKSLARYDLHWRMRHGGGGLPHLADHNERSDT